MIKAILFDLDGTLLPMDQDVFIKSYFGGLAKKLAPHGFEPQALIKAIWAGTKAMLTDQSSKTNEEVFWDVFRSIYGEDVLSHIPLFDQFYQTDFQQVRCICGFAPEAKRVVHSLKQQGYRVILATQPIFPAVATHSRIRWAGLEPEDFEFITTYENSRRCKPNPEYYLDILENAGLKPEECLMVGNDVADDMVAAKLGCHVFLLTDCLINSAGEDISVYPNGDFAALWQFLSNLP